MWVEVAGLFGLKISVALRFVADSDVQLEITILYSQVGQLEGENQIIQFHCRKPDHTGITLYEPLLKPAEKWLKY